MEIPVIAWVLLGFALVLWYVRRVYLRAKYRYAVRMGERYAEGVAYTLKMLTLASRDKAQYARTQRNIKFLACTMLDKDDALQTIFAKGILDTLASLETEMAKAVEEAKRKQG